MDIDQLLESAKKSDAKKKGKKEEFETLQKIFERFHLLNRATLDKETFEKAKRSIPSMAETVVNTIQYIDAEITHLRNKRAKKPFENVKLGEMQKIQTKNEMLVKEFLVELQK